MSEVLPIQDGDFPSEIESNMVSDAEIDAVARMLKAMGHPIRLKILCVLIMRGETSVRDLVSAVGTSQSNISQHLSVLRDKSILVCRKDANKVYYGIEDENIRTLMSSMKDTFCS